VKNPISKLLSSEVTVVVSSTTKIYPISSKKPVLPVRLLLPTLNFKMELLREVLVSLTMPPELYCVMLVPLSMIGVMLSNMQYTFKTVYLPVL